jgi:hypothetical protein
LHGSFAVRRRRQCELGAVDPKAGDIIVLHRFRVL